MGEIKGLLLFSITASNIQAVLIKCTKKGSSMVFAFPSSLYEKQHMHFPKAQTHILFIKTPAPTPDVSANALFVCRHNRSFLLNQCNSKELIFNSHSLLPYYQ